jgi:hypothetical protein
MTTTLSKEAPDFSPGIAQLIHKCVAPLIVSLAFVSPAGAQTSINQDAASPVSPASHRKLTCGPLGPSDDKEAIARIGSTYERPASIEQLLQNLKLAYESNLFLEPAFYVDANLSKFFAATKVRWDKPRLLSAVDRDSTARRIHISADQGVIQRMTIDVMRSCNSKVRYEAGKGYVKDRLVQAGSISLQMNDLNLTVASVRRVFGTETSYQEDTGLSEEGPPIAPTTNGKLVYAQDEQGKPPSSQIERDTVSFVLKLTVPRFRCDGPRWACPLDDTNPIEKVIIYQFGK